MILAALGLAVVVVVIGAVMFIVTGNVVFLVFAAVGLITAVAGFAVTRAPKETP